MRNRLPCYFQPPRTENHPGVQLIKTPHLYWPRTQWKAKLTRSNALSNANGKACDGLCDGTRHASTRRLSSSGARTLPAPLPSPRACGCMGRGVGGAGYLGGWHRHDATAHAWVENHPAVTRDGAMPQKTTVGTFLHAVGRGWRWPCMQGYQLPPDLKGACVLRELADTHRGGTPYVGWLFRRPP